MKKLLSILAVLLLAVSVNAADVILYTTVPTIVTNTVTNNFSAKLWQGDAYSPTGGEFTVTGGTALYDVTGMAAWITDPTNVTSITATAMGASLANLDGTLDGSAFTSWTTVASNAFFSADPDYVGAGLTSVILPNATMIGEDAFDSCTSMTNISLPAAVTIGEGAFNTCPADLNLAGTNLTSASLTSWAGTNLNITGQANITSLTDIPDGGGTNVANCVGVPFAIRSALATANWVLDDYSGWPKLWQGDSYEPTGNEFTITGTTNIIYDVANKAIYILDPENVTDVVLTTKDLDGEIDGNAFVNWTTLAASAFSPASGSASYSLFRYFTSTNITSLGASSFNDARSLTNCYTPNVVDIPDYAFAECSVLASYTFNDAIQTIADRGFKYTALAYVPVFSNLTSLGALGLSSSFYTNFTAPIIVTIGEGAFTGAGCNLNLAGTNLTEISLADWQGTFLDINGQASITSLTDIPDGSAKTAWATNASTYAIDLLETNNWTVNH